MNLSYWLNTLNAPWARHVKKSGTNLHTLGRWTSHTSWTHWTLPGPDTWRSLVLTCTLWVDEPLILVEHIECPLGRAREEVRYRLREHAVGVGAPGLQVLVARGSVWVGGCLDVGLSERSRLLVNAGQIGALVSCPQQIATFVKSIEFPPYGLRTPSYRAKAKVNANEKSKKSFLLSLGISRT